MIGTILYTTLFAYGAINAAQYQHTILLKRIMTAPQHFFDTTPRGRIVARFSADINVVDHILPNNFRQTILHSVRVGVNNSILTSLRSCVYNYLTFQSCFCFDFYCLFESFCVWYIKIALLEISISQIRPPECNFPISIDS